MRAFFQQSNFTDGALALALSPALTPTGIVHHPVFFSGFALYPQIIARGLLVLADITSTNYFQYKPEFQKDPVLSAQGDRVRAECFSACNGVYARLDLLREGLDGEIYRGTTNVDIGIGLRQALAKVNSKDRLHLNIGDQGLATRHIEDKGNHLNGLDKIILQRPVQMPNRWIRALGNIAEIHKNMKPVFTIKGPQAQMFVSTLPNVTSKNQSGWLVLSRSGIKLMSRSDTHSVYISGLHRLNALKRLITNIKSLTFYCLQNNEQGPCMIEVSLLGARLTLSLTAETWQGYSGEGALLTSLVSSAEQKDSKIVNDLLQFDALINKEQLSNASALEAYRIERALAYLAVSGKLGFDAYEGSYFHRELPEDPNRVLKDNPRLIGAHKLVDRIEKIDEMTWIVNSTDDSYRVSIPTNQLNCNPQCTCSWYLKNQQKKGPCKHVLAVQIKEGIYEL